MNSALRKINNDNNNKVNIIIQNSYHCFSKYNFLIVNFFTGHQPILEDETASYRHGLHAEAHQNTQVRGHLEVSCRTAGCSGEVSRRMKSADVQLECSRRSGD
jgi:hypothetical protein